ncbi:TBC1 domain family member 31-like [Condylostylus longicornis]|uniref:TBC1 domain family member 31-like n=1 Tax=Condylostylus longicornis TaxID=2530218 RepID=UPI00244E546D|nr:TBC1 domain family member 31-like [Condylostylus longicornis]
MNLSYDGKLLFVILKTGEINIFQTSASMNTLISTQKNINVVKRFEKKHDVDENFILTNELKSTLSRGQLLPILKEYGSYSNKYRHLIWNALLDLPSNNEHFSELLRKGFHSAVLKYDEEFPLKDVTLLRNLKRISSCLMYWSKILVECDYLPKLIFPFLKIFPNNSILAFELLVTIIYNHCQLWFEFAPMEPLNYLGLIENVLHHFDLELYKFYRERNITTKIYAWTLLTTSFSEILDEKQWYQLWDNILTKDLEYTIFVVLAYQIIQRNIIMNLTSQESIELFFHEQYIIDMQKFLKKANHLMELCPNDLNPRRYLKSFVSLPKGYYPKFENYPREWLELKNKETEAINLESIILDEKLRNLEIEEIQLTKRLEEGLKDEEIQLRLKELEKLYCGAISREEERIACQRKMVLLYEKEARNRRRKVLEMVHNSQNRKNINLHENQLDTLMRSIERARLRDETNMMLADEDLKDHELNLLSEVYKIKSNFYNKNFKYPVEDKKFRENNLQSIKNAKVNCKKLNALCSKDNDTARTRISETAATGHRNKNDIVKNFQKENDVIRKTYGIQLNTDCNPVVLDKKRTMQKNNKNKKNYIDHIEGILDQIQMEFENIVNPEIGSS